MYNSNFESNEFIPGDSHFSELIKNILPGNPSQHTIAILISAFLKSEGASRVAELQAKELSKIGYSVVVYTFRSDISPDGYKLEMIKSRVQEDATSLSKLYRALFPLNIWGSYNICSDLKNTSLIILHQETLVTAAFLSKILYNKKVIFWHHHITESRFLSLEEKLYDAIISPFNWRKISKFDLVVSISEHSRIMLQKKKGIDSIVIYDKIDISRFSKRNLNGFSIRKKYNIGHHDPVILFVGRIVPTKNIHSLILAFKVAKTSIPSAKLVIVGKDYDTQYSEALRKICNHDVIFAGFVSDEELPDYYAACDVYATCSLVEGFNMPLVEAQACGKPVVAFNIGPHREIIRNGFLVDEGNIEKFGETLIQVLRGGRIE